MSETGIALTNKHRNIIKTFRLSRPVHIRIHDDHHPCSALLGNMIVYEGRTYYMSITRANALDPVNFMYQAAQIKLMDDGGKYDVRKNSAATDDFSTFRLLNDPIEEFLKLKKIHQYFPKYLAGATRQFQERIMTDDIPMPETHVLSPVCNSRQRFELLKYYVVLGIPNIHIPLPPPWQDYVHHTVALINDINTKGFSVHNYNTYLSALGTSFRLKKIHVSHPSPIHHCEIIGASHRSKNGQASAASTKLQVAQEEHPHCSPHNAPTCIPRTTETTKVADCPDRQHNHLMKRRHQADRRASQKKRRHPVQKPSP